MKKLVFTSLCLTLAACGDKGKPGDSQQPQANDNNNCRQGYALLLASAGSSFDDMQSIIRNEQTDYSWQPRDIYYSFWQSLNTFGRSNYTVAQTDDTFPQGCETIADVFMGKDATFNLNGEDRDIEYRLAFQANYDLTPPTSLQDVDLNDRDDDGKFQDSHSAKVKGELTVDFYEAIDFSSGLILKEQSIAADITCEDEFQYVAYMKAVGASTINYNPDFCQDRADGNSG